jgi:HD superfamily phosphohydrolase
MKKQVHEIRDPIHIFIRMDSDERRVMDSSPFQRLRYIHQLALTYLVYPGATHRRFEHSLGVMELAGRVYDILTKPDHIHSAIRDVVPNDDFTLQYWRRVLRMAALCHDIGHLPFSHAAEADLLPKGWDHERLTVELVLSDELNQIWKELKIGSEDVAKLAVGPKKYHRYRPEGSFDNWEAILAEIIVGDAFGVDRIDYLLRDSHHAGVAYGRFDHYRLIDTLRILPKSEGDSLEPVLGIEEGGLHSAESLQLARYFMYTQLYFHPVRRIYDSHLQDFLKTILPDGFPTDIKKHMKWTDNEVTSKLLECARDGEHKANDPAKRIVERKHYKMLYTRNPEDVLINPEAAQRIYEAAITEFGREPVRIDTYTAKGNPTEFPVLATDNRIISSLAMSDVLKSVPVVAIDYVFV